MKQTNAINLVAVEETKVRRRRPQKARKVEKLTKTVGSATTKHRVENMC